MANKAKKILIMEDEKPIRQALGLKLESAGFSVTTAINGKEGIDKIIKEKFDLILLDIIMPEMDGYEVLTELQKMKISIPIIILSNLGQDEDIEKAKKFGVTDYFIKSDTPINDIVSRIKNKIK